MSKISAKQNFDNVIMEDFIGKYPPCHFIHQICVTFHPLIYAMSHQSGLSSSKINTIKIVNYLETQQVNMELSNVNI